MSVRTQLMMVGAMAVAIAVSPVASASPYTQTCTTPPKEGYYSFPAEQITQLLKQIDDQTLASEKQHTQYVDKVMAALEPQLKELLETGKTAPPPAKPSLAPTSDGPPALSLDEPSAWEAMTEPMAQRGVERAPVDLLDTVQSLMRGEPMMQIDPIPESRTSQRQLDSNPRQVLPDAPDLAAEGKDLEKTFQQQIDGFKQLNALLSKLLKDVNPVSGCLQSDISSTVQGLCIDFLKYGMTNSPGFCDADALKAYVRVAKAYVAAIFSQEMGLAGDKLVSDHLLVNYLMDTPPNTSDFDYFNTTPDPIAIATVIYKMPQAQAIRTDMALSLATRSAIDIMKVTRPEFAAAVRIELLRAMAPLLFAVNDRTKHLGLNVPSRALLLEYVSRINNKIDYSYGKSAKTRKDHNRIPAKLALFDPQAKTVVDVPLCVPKNDNALFLSNEELESDKIAKAQNDAYKMNNGTSGKSPLIASIDEYMPKSGGPIYSLPVQLESSPMPFCISFKAFANVAINPLMLGDGKKPFYDWAQVGNSCGGLPQGTPPPKTSWVDTVHQLARYAWDTIQSLGIGTAYAGILPDPEACAQLEKFKSIVFCKDDPAKGCVDAYYGDKWCSKVWTKKPPINPGDFNWYEQCIKSLTTFCKGDSGIAPESGQSGVPECMTQCINEVESSSTCKVPALLSAQTNGYDFLDEYMKSPSCTIPMDITPNSPYGVSAKKGDKCSDYGSHSLIFGCKSAKHGCQKKCLPNAVCGNGILEGDESCDPPGSYPSGAFCSSKCYLISACTSACKNFTMPTPACAMYLKFESDPDVKKYPDLSDGACKIPFDIPPKFKKGDSSCSEAKDYLDDACQKEGDVCYNKCVEAQGQDLQVCGNGEADYGETCDDGNTVAGDGCNEKCQKETPVCGNGKVEKGKGGETCDDGNTTNGDGCNDKCQKEWCAECSLSNLPDCTSYLSFKPEQLGSCFLAGDFISTGKIPLCLAGESCACKLKFDALTCKTAQVKCYDECKKVAGPKPPETLSKEECNNWKLIKGGGWNIYTGTAPEDSLGFFDAPQPMPPEQSATIAVQEQLEKQFKEGGAKKFEKVWPLVVAWAEYYLETTFDKNDLDHAKQYALNILSKATYNQYDSFPGVAFFHPASEGIYWNAPLISIGPNDIAVIGAHETVHAAFFDLIGLLRIPLDLTKKLPDGFPPVKSFTSINAEHYWMAIVQETMPEFTFGAPLAWGGTYKDDLCPAGE